MYWFRLGPVICHWSEDTSGYPEKAKKGVCTRVQFVFFPSGLLTTFQLKGNQKSLVCFVSNSQKISLKSPEVFHWTQINSFTYLHVYDLVSDFFFFSLSPFTFFSPPERLVAYYLMGRTRNMKGYTASSYWIMAVFRWTEFLKMKSATLHQHPFLDLFSLLVSYCMYLFI